MAIADILAQSRSRIQAIVSSQPTYSAQLPRAAIPRTFTEDPLESLFAGLSREVPDWGGYLADNPDVQREYERVMASGRSHKYVKFGYDYDGSGTYDPHDAAQAHWNLFGKTEGRTLRTRTETPGWLSGVMASIRGLW